MKRGFYGPVCIELNSKEFSDKVDQKLSRDPICKYDDGKT